MRSEAADGGDGLSWTSAYNDLATAVGEAVKSEDAVLYVAEGVYQISSQIAVTNGLLIMGGYAADGSARDTEVYQTIFTGDTGLNDTWAHVVPKLGEFAFEEVVSDLPVVADGKFSPPPAYTGIYDCYIARKPAGDSNAASGLKLCASASLAVDGIWFIGFDGSAVSVDAGASGAVKDCRFYACSANGNGVVYVAGSSLVFSDCDFKYLSQIKSGDQHHLSTGYYFRSGVSPTLKNTSFESVVGPNVIRCDWNAGAMSMSGISMTRCVFLSTTGNGDDHGFGGALGFRGGSVQSLTDSVFTNNLTMSTTENAASVFNFYSAFVNRCLFAGNRLECKPVAGKAYTMIGCNFQKSGTVRIYSSVFRDNVIAAVNPAGTDSESTAMLALLGNGAKNGNNLIVNSQFEGNAFETPTDGMQYLKASCVGSMNLGSTSLGVLTTVINCTFLGSPTPDAYEVMQYGLSVSQNTTLLNCLFMNKYADVARPLLAQCVSKTDIQSCTMQGVTSPPDGITYNGLKSGRVLFEPCGDRLGFVRPSVRMDAITGGLNVYTNSASSVGIVYKNTAGVCINATPSLHEVNGYGGLYCDAFNNARPDGAFRRGAVQVLSDAAEKQCAITVSCEPTAGGSVNLIAQNVATNATAAAVTATPSQGCNFIGWYLADGKKISDQATLSDYVALTDTNIVAKFSTPLVTLTFDLGEYATFADGNNRYTARVASGLGFSLAQLPAYKVATGWHIYDWEPALPDLVPDGDTTYTIKAVEDRVRIIHVVPKGEAAGKKDGSSWADATDDIVAAYADAGIYRGEVWLKEGLYHLGGKTTTITLLPNVTVRGGFRGIAGEKAADARPREYRSVISGDLSGDDYWKPNGQAPADTAAAKIFGGDRGTTFNPPNPELQDNYWAWDGDNDDNAAGAFAVTSSESFTNSLITGVTFTGFNSYAVSYTYSKSTDGIPEIRSCDFLGGQKGIHAGFNITVEDCNFIGLHDAIYTDKNITINNSRFDRCYHTGSGNKAGCIDLSGGTAQISGTTFYGNYGTGKSWRNAVIMRNAGVCIISNSLIEANYSNDAFALFSAEGNQYKIYDTIFLNNRSYLSGNEAHETAVATCLGKIGNNTLIQNTSFVSNTLTVAAAMTDGTLAGNAIRAIGNTQILNSSFLDNITTDNDTGRTTCNAATIAASGALVLAHVTIDGTSLNGDTAAEICATASNLAIINSLIESEKNAIFVKDPAATIPFIRSSSVRDLDITAFTLGENDSIKNLTTNKVSLTTRKTIGANGTVHKGLTASSPLVNTGEKVYLATDNLLYIYDATTNAAKPWRKLIDKTSYNATVPGLTEDMPYLSDAVHAKRTKRRNSPGSVNAIRSSLMIIIK